MSGCTGAEENDIQLKGFQKFHVSKQSLSIAAASLDQKLVSFGKLEAQCRTDVALGDVNLHCAVRMS